MYRSFLLTSAALAQLAAAHPSDHKHGRNHEKRDVVQYETDVDVVTEVDYVTIWQGWSSQGEATTSTESTSVYVAPTSSPSEETVGYTAPSSSSATTTTTPTTLATSYRSSSIASSSSSATASASGISTSSLTPNGKKAGLSGYVGVQDIAAFSDLAPYISWYSDYTPNTPTVQGVQGVGMLWGASGSTCGSVETDRLATFSSMLSGGTTPDIMFGFYEPDCTCPMSSDMSVSSAASAWESLLAPLGEKGTVLGSPSMCKQYDETFLTPFNSSITRTWDVTSIHINKPDLAGAQKDVEYYVKTYGKPVWVSEFACVNDQPSWEPCTDQTQIDTFINDVVKYFEGNSDVVAYGPSNGAGLGDVWPLTTSDGQLTPSGQTYLSAVKAL